jgi:hypothetical protein
MTELKGKKGEIVTVNSNMDIKEMIDSGYYVLNSEKTVQKGKLKPKAQSDK